LVSGRAAPFDANVLRMAARVEACHTVPASLGYHRPMRTWVWMPLVIVALAAGPAAAGDKAAAEAAFLQGRGLMKAKKYVEACTAFEKSQQLDAEFGTEYNLARCYEQVGRLASAWTAYRELAQRDTNPGRRTDSARRASGLAPRLTKLLVSVRDPVDGLVVTRNGEVVTASVGIESPVDPGDYEIAASAPGYAAWSIKVSAAKEGGTVQVTVPALDKKTAAPPPPPDKVVPPRPHHTTPLPGGPAVVGKTSSGSSGKVIGLSVGGAGVLATGVGLYFGYRASSKWSDAQALCPGPSGAECPDAATKTMADDLSSSAKTAGNVSTVLVGVGVAAVATGVVLYVTAPRHGPAEHALRIVPTASPDGFAVTAAGSF
jgi:hypothetical protein